MPEPNDQNSLALVVRGNRRTAVAPPPINGSPLSEYALRTYIVNTSTDIQQSPG